MWDLEALKKTRVYQEAKEEGRLEAIQEARLEGRLDAVPHLFSVGVSVEQIAQMLGLDVEAVRQAVQQQPSSD